MSGSARTISVPIGRRLQVFSQTLLPAVVFFAAFGGVVYLLRSQAGSAGFTGEMFVLTADAAPVSAGRLMPLNSPEVVKFIEFMQTQSADSQKPFNPPKPNFEVQEFARVEKGQVIGVVDPAPLMKQYAVLKAQYAHIQATIASTRAETVFAELEAKDRHFGDMMQMVEALAKLQVQLVETQGLKASAEVAFFAAKDEYDRLVKIYEKYGEGGGIAFWQITQAKNLKDIAAQTWRAHRDTCDKLNAEINIQTTRMKQQPGVPVAEIKALLEPIEKELAAQQETVQQLTTTFDSLLVTAPIDGVISVVLKRPGQTVAASESVVTIASERSPYIIGYIRLNQTAQPKGGWLKKQVDVVVPSDPRNTIRGYIQHVGVQVVQVPVKQQRDPRYPEWGLPVAVALPPSELKGRNAPYPGELVQIMIRQDEWKGEDAGSTVTAAMRDSISTASRTKP